MFADFLLGLSILIATASFAFGIFVGYALWGYRYFRVVELESSIAMSRGKAARLREEQSTLHARLQQS